MASSIFYTIEDADGDESVIDIPVSFASIIDGDGLAFAVEYGWDIIEPLLNGHLVRAGVTVEVEIAAFTNTAAAVLSDVQEKATFIFRAIGGFPKSISLPTFIETFFTGAGAGKEVDVTQAAVTAFNTLIEDGFHEALVSTDPLTPVTTHGEDVDVFVSGHQSWGRNRR